MQPCAAGHSSSCNLWEYGLQPSVRCTNVIQTQGHTDGFTQRGCADNSTPSWQQIPHCFLTYSLQPIVQPSPQSGHSEFGDSSKAIAAAPQHLLCYVIAVHVIPVHIYV